MTDADKTRISSRLAHATVTEKYVIFQLREVCKQDNKEAVKLPCDRYTTE